MNSVFSDSDDRIDTSVVFAQLRELLPKVKKVESITVLKEFTELAYKDHEMDVRFEFISPHTVKMVYHGNEWVSIEDEEFRIFAGNKTEEEAMMEYICHLDFLWERYIASDLSNRKKTQGLTERIETIKSNVKKLW